MKKLFIVIGIVISSAILYSQNMIDPPSLPIDFNDTTVFDRNWSESHFIKGWNWGSAGATLDEALLLSNFTNFPTL